MRKSTTAVVAAFAAAAVSVTGISLATVAAAQSPVTAVSATGSPRATAQTLLSLHDQLASAQSRDDVNGVRTAVTAIGKQLDTLRTPQGRTALTPDQNSTVDQASAEDVQLAQALAPQQGPAAADPLSSLGDLINQFLQNLMSLIDQLLGISSSSSSMPTTSSSAPGV